MKITRTAQKQLRKMQKQDAMRLINALEQYEAKGQGDVKALQGREGYRLRIGNMRAIFEIVDDMIVLQAGYRGNIYER
jgi:mRNA interferase RelE/StbE